MNEKELLQSMFEAAVKAAQPEKTIPDHLPPVPPGRTVVIGAGKASAEMARVFEAHWNGPLDKLSGLVVTRYDYAVECRHIEIVEAAHPVPDQAGAQAAKRILETVGSLSEDDLVVCLISGGGSSLLSLPAPGLTLDDKQQINRALLKSGANIREMNCVRKHLSAIKGGRLAAATYPAKLVTLMISDVPDDDPDVIASGPTVPDPTTFSDAIDIINKYGITEPAVAIEHLKKGHAGEKDDCYSETPKHNDPRLGNSEAILIATPQMSLEAAASVARAKGISPVILGDSIEGESSQVAIVHAGIAKQIVRHQQPTAKPCVLLSGGETTVTVTGNGRGGRNAEFSLSLALALNELPGVHSLAADTDGIDGSEDNAGCFVSPDTLKKATETGIKAGDFLQNNDAYSFFNKLDDLLITGPTLTNVNDFRAILIT